MAKISVRFDPTKASLVRDAVAKLGIKPTYAGFDYFTVDVTPEVALKLSVLPGVLAVSKERTHTIFTVSVPVSTKLQEFSRLLRSNPVTGPLRAFRYSLQADKQMVRVPTAESRKIVGADLADIDGITGKGVKVAVIDTGIDYLGVQGSGTSKQSTVKGMPSAQDENGHGTHTATTIGGRAYKSVRGNLLGVAPEAEIGVFKVLGYGIGFGTTSAVLKGMWDAAWWGANVISMSLGSEFTEDLPEDIPECRAIEQLVNEGIIVVVANGNSGPNPRTVGVPANSPFALSVGAVDVNGTLASFSSRGPTAQNLIKPDCVAPGVNILSTSSGLIAMMQIFDGPPKLACISGTSMACPHVSGVVALALQYARSKGRILTSAGIKEALSRYGYREKNNDSGFGLLTYQMLKTYIDA